MKSLKFGWVACLLGALVLAGCGESGSQSAQTQSQEGNKAAENQMFSTGIEKASYLLGFNQASGLRQQTEGQVNADAFAAGARDALADNPNALAFVEFNDVVGALQEAIDTAKAGASAPIIAAGDAFRAEYAKQDGVTELPSGLLYKVLVAGDGEASPSLSDTVTTHYHGTLTDGTVFDSSVERGQPASFPVNGVISGWTEALQLMSVGDKWELVIPPQLAYGERGAGAQIKPHSTLVFEVELISID